MTLTAIVLLLFSAVFHAGWNMLGKRENPSRGFFLLANFLGCLCLTPALILNPETLGLFPPKVWLLLGLTGLFQAIYYSGLAGAYSTGDMSIAYPIARSAPVIIVAGLNFMIGKGHDFSPIYIAGMVLVVVGGLILPVRCPREWKLRDYIHISGLLALVAAVGTSGYSITDDSALRLLRSTPGMPNRTLLTLTYGLLEGLSTSFWLGLSILLNRKARKEYPIIAREQFGKAALAGVGIFTAYTLVLLAMGFADNISYVVAFRQLGIPLGAMLGITILHEPCFKMKFLGILVMLIGLILVAVG